MIQDWISKLTDRYIKDPKSNIGKVLTIISDEVDTLSDTISTVESWRDLQQAKGTTLDLIGADFSQPRGQMPDEIYRSIIIAKIVQGQSDGTYNKMITAIAKTLSCDLTDIVIQADSAPAAIIVQRAPLTALNSIGLSINQFIQIVEQVVSAGVSITSINLEGTFGFASGTSLETSIDGFADLAQTTGGIFGGLFAPEDDYKLPI
ncbi:hypothetical protein [Sporolactobacillus pectinivorans]|uniref:hypothetical protein n=1 Tax=Sporolactobacillus pectinivorans TaxID=1591408 RepID=UPI000C269D8E|nr:hypothetical protein [Sporolactobacillus pectinivorans]